MKYWSHLTLADGIVQGVVDLLRLDAEALGRIAVDVQRRCGAGNLLIRGNVTQHGQRLHLLQHLRRPTVQFGRVEILPA